MHRVVAIKNTENVITVKVDQTFYSMQWLLISSILASIWPFLIINKKHKKELSLHLGQCGREISIWSRIQWSSWNKCSACCISHSQLFTCHWMPACTSSSPCPSCHVWSPRPPPSEWPPWRPHVNDGAWRTTHHLHCPRLPSLPLLAAEVVLLSLSQLYYPLYDHCCLQ